MAAEVSYSLIRVMNGYKEEQDRTIGNESMSEKSTTTLITRDLLGGSSELSDSKELDLDLQVPNGWEKRLDLKSGKIYIQKCNSPLNSPSISDSKKQHQQQLNPTVLSKLQDLNFPPSPLKLMNRNRNLEETSLDLKLVSSSSSSSNNIYYNQSVCTLDKVKSALQRVENEPPMKKRSSNSIFKSSSSPSSYSLSSSSIKEYFHKEEDKEEKRISSSSISSSPIAAGCSRCLTYVLTTRNNPRCPRCNSVVQLPTAKKARVDLNMSIKNFV